MKNKFWLVLGLLFFLVACDNNSTIEKGSLIPARIAKPFNNTSVQKGREIEVQLEIAAKEDIQEIEIYTADTVIFKGSAEDADKTFKISTSNWKIGTNQLSLKTTTNDGKVRNDHRIVKILPTTFPIDYKAEVVKVYPHQTSAYTQGLEFDNGQLYEGTGGHGNGYITQSRVAKIDLHSGATQLEHQLPKKYFGEGITILNDKLYQLTWQEHTCFIYDKNTLQKLDSITYTGEGWGLCNDGQQLIMSDGSERIYFRDPNNFNLRKVIEVYTNQGPVKGLNELEYIQGKIYANVYTQDYMVIIDPETGIVTGKIDATLVALDYRKNGEVLNGIAYKEDTKQLFITGKEWPNLLEIALVEL